MGGIPRPRPCYLDLCEPIGSYNGEKRWRSRDGNRIYTWDSLHGEIEVYNKRGFHLGALDAISGKFIKGAVKGRKIDV